MTQEAQKNIALNLKKAIGQHEKLLKEAIKSSQQICLYAKDGDINRVEGETMNRDRLVNVVSYIQERIEKSIKTITPNVLTEEINQLITDWQTQLARSIESILSYDKDALSLLERAKTEVQQEISTIHKNNVRHKGYDLSNVKK